MTFNLIWHQSLRQALFVNPDIEIADNVAAAWHATIAGEVAPVMTIIVEVNGCHDHDCTVYAWGNPDPINSFATLSAAKQYAAKQAQYNRHMQQQRGDAA